jgi:hypothetical protein
VKRSLPHILGIAFVTFAIGVSFGITWNNRLVLRQANAADSIMIEAGPVEISRKFDPEKSFADFPTAERYKGKAPAYLDYSTCIYGRMYKSICRKAADSGANFAGHYAFQVIQCGPSCQLSVVVDLKTGKVYAGPQAGSGYQFYIGSKILVVNPPDSHGWYSPCGYCIPEQYLWTGVEFKKLQ